MLIVEFRVPPSTHSWSPKREKKGCWKKLLLLVIPSNDEIITVPPMCALRDYWTSEVSILSLLVAVPISLFACGSLEPVIKSTRSVQCSRSILIRSVGRFSLKRSICTTRALKGGSSNNHPDTPDSSHVPAKTPRATKSVKEKPSRTFSPADIKPYNAEEKVHLAKKYTPAQLAAIEAGETSIAPKDIYEQGVVRQDPFRLTYQTDDLSMIMPVIDKPVIAPEENYDPNLRFKTTDEIASDLADWLQDAPEDATAIDYGRFVDNMRLKVGKEEAERNPPRYVAPDIPKGIPALEAAVTKKTGEFDTSASVKRLMKQTGFDRKNLATFRVRALVQHRVVNQTRLGKIQSTYYLAVAGNGRGLLGIGEGKSAEANEAVSQAKNNAIRNMQPIPRYEERTIFGDVRIKVGAVELELMTRPPGMSSLVLPCA